jgi:hypothetical protein
MYPEIVSAAMMSAVSSVWISLGTNAATDTLPRVGLGQGGRAHANLSDAHGESQAGAARHAGNIRI